MGISGLLPLLKSVQKPIHLSELAGKSIAVDAYVWLHRGAYMCAADIVTGKPTTKYVDYAMNRIRLLRHYNITPYLVFDGGPLPAKKGTEVERKRKRDESLELANSLMKQGKHGQAREHYVKCVDITPQMAFQLIKALRADNVRYVVAPYEADAQLYYLESIGIVDGVLTEDSDLVIFGTKLVLTKFDPITATCISIRSETLASNSPADLPLHGWSLKELRECAMLSGCDYIDGVRGVGLKTASKYLRKWGTLERALRAIRMDGKCVEKDWEARMRKAEAGFLHQRVWDPIKEEIVHLSPPDMETWNEEKDKYVGAHIEAELAKRLVRGDADPETLEPMIDIVPSYQPGDGPSRTRPLAFADHNSTSTPKYVSQKGTLLNYFSKENKVIPVPVASTSKVRAGKESGKRTLAEEYDREVSAKRCKVADLDDPEPPSQTSKFFSHPPNPVVFDDDKEDLEQLEELDDEDEVKVTELIDHIVDFVQQEDGYVSPAFSSPERLVSSYARGRSATPDFSSPLQHCPISQKNPHTPPEEIPVTPQRTKQRIEELQLGGDLNDSPHSSSDGRITSPPSILLDVQNRPSLKVRMLQLEEEEVTIPESKKSGQTIQHTRTFSVDIGDIFVADSDDTSGNAVLETAADAPTSPSEDVEQELENRRHVVAAGWEKRFANPNSRLRNNFAKAKEPPKSPSKLRRRETMAGPLHTGSPRFSRKSRPRLSEPILIPISPIQRDPIIVDVENADDIISSPSSQHAVVDEPVISNKGSTLARLQCFRYR